MALDHAFFNALRTDLEAALKQTAARHGLKSLDLGRISVDAMGGFRAQVAGIMGNGIGPEESNYNTTRRYSDYVLPEVGAEVVIRGQRWRIVGQKTRGRQMIIADKMPDGRRYLLPPESFERNFARKTAEEASRHD